MRKIGVIPSRWGSTRFPGKSLAPICGKPLVQWVVEACLKARELDDVIVATDDERIALAVQGMSAKAVMTRPDHPSGTDRVAEAADPADDDIIVNIQGDEPLLNPDIIDNIVRRMVENPDVAMATACTPIRSAEERAAPTIVKLVLDASDNALYFSRLPIPFRRDGAADLSSGLYQRHIGIYGYRGSFLRKFISEKPCALEKCESLEQLRALSLGAKIAVVRTDEPGIGVDKPEDVATVEAIMRQRGIV